MGVAEPAIAPAREPGAVTDLDEVGQARDLILGLCLRAWRHVDDLVGPARAGPVLPHAGASILGLEMLLVAIVDQRVEAGDALNPDVATFAAVAAVGSAELDELFTPEGD